MNNVAHHGMVAVSGTPSNTLRVARRVSDQRSM